jgi:hypothetical protein
MEYTNFEREFIERTLEILDQYDKYVAPNVTQAKRFEVTLLINSLLGLLLLPRQRLLPSIPNCQLSSLGSDWGIKPGFVTDWGKNSDESLMDFIRHLRNGAAHIRLAAFGNGEAIVELHFEDTNGFRAKLPIANLRMFVTKLAETLISTA